MLKKLFSLGSGKPAPTPMGMQAFTFGDPVPVLDTVDLMSQYLKAWHNGRFYEVPVNLQGLYRSQYANPHHLSAIQLKVNLVCDLFVPSSALSLPEFRKFALNQIVFGNGYLLDSKAITAKTMTLAAQPALYVRRIDDTDFGRLEHNQYELTPYKDKIIHVPEPDLEQDHYGKPYYLPALQAAWLNEDATLFRRKYYKNGNHAGFILYLSDPAHSLDDVNALKKALKEAKGPGAFRNLFFYAPKGKKDGMQVIPVESAQAQDKFFDIKNASRDDVLAMHRVPPNLLAVQATNAGGFGNILEARFAMLKNEIVPWAKYLSAFHPALQFNFDDLETVASQPQGVKP